MSTAIIGKDAPPLGIPKSSNICKIAAINTTCDIVANPKYLAQPPIEGHEYLNLPTWGYFITNEKTGANVLFDLGCRKDWDNLSPRSLAFPEGLPGIHVEKDIVDILAEGNIKASDISAAIISHWHFDHSGDMALFPDTVDAIVGPGFKDTYLPGYPDKKDSPFLAVEFAKRNVIEAPFSDQFKIGKFEAHDFFGDDSLYVLNVPGHTTGHISALVRTTPDTFIFLGGDVCHFNGMFRPSDFVPLPDEIPQGTFLDKAIKMPCPCAVFARCHPDPPNSSTTPFYKPSRDEHSFYDDADTAIESIKALAEFDADPNVLVTIAHDPTLLDVYQTFPTHTINDWKAKGWKESTRWGFFSELPYPDNGGKPVRKPLRDGVYLRGKKLRTLTGEKV